MYSQLKIFSPANKQVFVYSLKTVTMAKSEPSTTQIDKLTLFMDSTHIPTFSHNLRNVLLEHMATKKTYDFNHADFISDTINLFNLLDALEEKNK